MPGQDLKANSDFVLSGSMAGFIIHRGFADPNEPTKGFAGPTQDVAVY
jgi:hypothetical protein